MPWVTRDVSGKIVTFSTNPREGAQQVADDAPEVLALLNPPPPPRELPADAVMTALKAAGKLVDADTTAAAAKDKDRFYWQRRASFVEDNPKLARLAQAAGWDVKAIFDAAAAL